METVVYKASPTLRRFHQSVDFVRGAMGPIGSGKSVACCMEILRRAKQQAPHDGIRKSRWAIIRNTYRELVDTTMETWFDWIPRSSGVWRAQDMKFTLREYLEDGTELHLEVLFRALDKPNDIKKLLSLELTGGWINEAREIPKQVLDMLQGRVGRYPSKREGGPSWFGIICDTNPPDSDHWWYTLFEESGAEGFKLFKQPSGMSEEAENIDNLPPDYYKNMIQGKDQEWINVYVHGMYGFIADGKPIYPEYKDDVHVAKEPLFNFGGTIYVGVDFGLTPAALIAQKTPSGQVQIIDELVTEDMGAVNFGMLLHEKLASKYCGCDIEVYGDPAGEQRSQTDEMTPFQILWNQNIDIVPAPTNDFTIRREVTANMMMRLAFNGEPAFVICPVGAPMFRKACAGGYKYKRMQVSGEQRFQDKPYKGRYSHVAEAGQYCFLGMLGDEHVIGGYHNEEPDYSKINRGIV